MASELIRVRLRAAAAAVTAALLALPAGAQTRYDYEDIRQEPGRSEDGEQARLRVVPRGWVAIGYDLTGDGELDTYELIQAYDLEQARTQSARRRDNERQLARMLDDPRFMGDRFEHDLRRHRRESRALQRLGEPEWAAPGDRGLRDEDTFHVRGRIDRLSAVESDDTGEKHLVAWISTDQGSTAVVDLGPLGQVRPLQLDEGDRVEALAQLGSLDGKTILEADRIRARGQQVSVDRMGRDAFHLRGTVLALRSATRRDSGERHVLALVRLEDGSRTSVDLGPEHRLPPRGPEIGQRLSFVAEPALLGGQEGLVAKHVLLDGALLDVRGGRRAPMAGQPMGRAREASAARFREEAGVLPVRMDAASFRFEPAYIVAAPGQRIRLTLRNVGDHPHDIAFQMPGAAAATFDRPLSIGESDTITFRAPDTPGTYTFFCPIEDHRERGMEGRLVVRTAGG